MTWNDDEHEAYFAKLVGAFVIVCLVGVIVLIVGLVWVVSRHLINQPS